MSKRQEIRARRQRARRRGRLVILLLVVAGAVLITFALVMANRPTADINPITPKTFTVPVDGTSVGDPQAPVKIDVWEDFQCPACQTYSQTIEPQLLQNYVETGKVLYTFHFYPFIDGGSLTGESHRAADAAKCAGEQGRFWDFHDLLFANWNGENQGAFADSRLTDFARYLELDMSSFNSCMNASTYAAEIEADYQAGLAAGVTGTPSVFVDGTMMSPGFVPTYEEIAAAVDAILAGQ